MVIFSVDVPFLLNKTPFFFKRQINLKIKNTPETVENITYILKSKSVNLFLLLKLYLTTFLFKIDILFLLVLLKNQKKTKFLIMLFAFVINYVIPLVFVLFFA